MRTWQEKGLFTLHLGLRSLVPSGLQEDPTLRSEGLETAGPEPALRATLCVPQGSGDGAGALRPMTAAGLKVGEELTSG